MFTAPVVKRSKVTSVTTTAVDNDDDDMWGDAPGGDAMWSPNNKRKGLHDNQSAAKVKAKVRGVGVLL